MKRYKIKRKQADGSFVELSLDTSIDSVYRVKDGNIKTLTDILTEEYAPKDNPVFTGSISLGRKAGTTTGPSSFAVGNNVTASSRCTHAEGYETTASGDYSHAEGYSTTASGHYSHTEGDDTTASGNASHAEGAGSIASGDFSHAEGDGTTASGNYSHAEGGYTTASGYSSHAEGHGTIAQGQNQHVQGKYNIKDTANKYAHIVGNGPDDSHRSNAHTLDWNGNAWYAGDVQANNVPCVVGEKVVLTVPAATITAKKTEIDNITDDRGPVLIPVDGTLTYDPTNSYYLKYNNKNYSVTYDNDHRAFDIAGTDCKCIIETNDVDNTTTLVIFSLDTTNITDIQLFGKDIKKLDNMYIPNDLKVNNSITLGGRKGTIGEFSSSFGLNCEASGDSSHAEGGNTTASGNYSHAEGVSTTASGNYSHAEGKTTTASGGWSHAEGYNNTASGDYTHAEGGNTTASGFNSHVEGHRTIASGEFSHVQGKCNIEDTENKYAHIVGNGPDDSHRSNAHTLDWKGNAWYAGQVEGTNLPYTVSSKKLATVPANDINNNIKLGNEITVNNISINKDKRYYIEFLGVKKLCGLMLSVENGNGFICIINNYKIEAYNDSTDITISINKMNNDIGDATLTDLIIHEEDNKYLDSKYLETDLILQNSISLGRVGDIGAGSSAIGYMVEASGLSSHAEGNAARASGTMSHAEGEFTLASGDTSHAEGITTTASGNYSHAEGGSTTASGEQSHAEGYNTTASGDNSHAEGNTTTASGDSSHAEGLRTKASSEYQHVQGKFNIEDTANKYAHIVGNGSRDNTRSNAHTLDWKGNAWYAGKLTVGAAPTDDMDVVTKKYMIDNTVNASYVDTKVASLVDSAPETLDTLKELSTALGDDPNFATTVTTSIGTKLNKPATEGTEGQVLSKAADGSNVWVDNGINEDDLNTMLTNTFGFVAK